MALNLKTALGTQTDCQRLIDNFSKSSTALSFADFADQWRKLNFDCIFCGREPKAETPQFVRELLSIAKGFFFSPLISAKRIGALYLLYSIYFKQNTNQKIRITLNELKNLNEFVGTLHAENHREAEFVFYKLFVNNGFSFCALSTEHFYLLNQKGDEVEVDPFSELQSDLLELMSSDMLQQLDALHSRYQDIKLAISNPDSNDTSLKTIKHDYIKEVQAELATLKKNIERSRGTKHSKPAAKRTDFSDESSSMSDLSDESNEEEDIGTRRQRIKAKSFQDATDFYRLPGGSRAPTRKKRGRKSNN